MRYVLLDYDIKEHQAYVPSSSSSSSSSSSLLLLSSLSSSSRPLLKAGATDVYVTARIVELDLDLHFDIENTSNSTLVKQRTTPMTVYSNGAVIDGSSVLVHLPHLQQNDQTTVSRLPLADVDEGALMMWNKSTQSSYSIYDHQPRYLPSIIYCRQRSMSDVDACRHKPKRRRLQ